MREYRHIIWDWNGTLLDDAWLAVDIINGLLARRKLPKVTLESYAELFDFPVIEYYRKLGFDLEAEPFDGPAMEFISEYHRRRTECRLRTGAFEILEALKSAGFGQSILSAYHQSELETVLEEFAIRGFFARVIGLDNHYAKGKAHLAADFVGAIGLPRRAILFVGDTLHDAEVAGLMAVDCVLIPGGHQSRKRLEAAGTPVLNTLADLGRFLCLPASAPNKQDSRHDPGICS